MSVKEIYMLPNAILLDIAMLIEYEDIEAKDVMRYIKRYYKGEIRFTLNQLKKYLNDLKQKRKNKMSSSKIIMPQKTKNKEIENLTNMPQPMVDYKNKAAVMEWLRKIAIERITMVVSEQRKNPRQIITEVDALLLNQQKVLADIMEKEDKMKLTMIESTQHKQFLKNELSKILMILRSVLKKRLSYKKYKEVADDLSEVLSLYKIKL